MLPQIGMTELLLIGAVALIVVGPKDLPLLLRRVGKFVGQAKRMAREFQSTFDELGRQAELEALRKEVEALKKETTADLEKDIARTNRELSDAMRDTSHVRTAPVAAKAGEENRIAPPSSPAGEAAPVTHPAAAAKPAGPRIETPSVQARPRPEPVAAQAKTDQA